MRSYMFQQHKSIPMDRKLSRQISSMVAMHKEMVWSKTGISECRLLKIARYKANIYIFWPGMPIVMVDRGSCGPVPNYIPNASTV